jgi:hypothetical protein
MSIGDIAFGKTSVTDLRSANQSTTCHLIITLPKERINHE